MVRGPNNRLNALNGARHLHHFALTQMRRGHPQAGAHRIQHGGHEFHKLRVVAADFPHHFEGGLDSAPHVAHPVVAGVADSRNIQVLGVGGVLKE